MSQKSSLYRTVEILRELNEGKKLCIGSLALHYEIHERTIQRDFKLIREIFGDFITKEGQYYQGYKKVLLDNLLHASDLMTLANIMHLFNITDKKSLISVQTDMMIKNSMSIYDFKSKPFEIIKNQEILKKLEHAIRFNKEIILTYKGQHNTKERVYNPYKIIFLSENFYVVGENIKKERFESLRVALIQKIVYGSKNFYKNPKIDYFIDNIQTPWGQYGAKEIVVKLYIYSHVAKYFILKKYLPSQTITQKFDNGDLELEYRVTSLKEMEELLIKWLPNVKVLEPIVLNEMVKEVLLKKLDAC